MEFVLLSLLPMTSDTSDRIMEEVTVGWTKIPRKFAPKRNGRSIMVSAFLCECHGIFQLDDQLKAFNPEIPMD